MQARPCVPAEQDNKEAGQKGRSTHPTIGIRVYLENSLEKEEEDRLNEYMVRRVMHLNREEDNSKGEPKISAAIGWMI